MMRNYQKSVGAANSFQLCVILYSRVKGHDNSLYRVYTVAVYNLLLLSIFAIQFNILCSYVKAALERNT